MSIREKCVALDELSCSGENGGYLMIKSLKVKNFRCFERLELTDLARVNVIVGQSAAGKTAILEALRLALGGTPQVAFQLNNSRGYTFYGPGPSRELFEGVWNSLFFRFENQREITTEVTDNEGRSASLAVQFDPTKSVTATAPVPQLQSAATIVPLAFKRLSFAREESVLYATVHSQGQLNLEQGPELGLATEFFASSWLLNQQQNAIWFSQLSLENREKEVVNAIRKEFAPLLTDIQVLSVNQFTPSVYATVPFLETKIPLSLLSAGITKFFSLIAAMLYRKGGIILIDEIENGIYYERFQALWELLLRLAKANDTQIFVSTHSIECLRALAQVMQSHEHELLLLRAGRESDVSTITPVPGSLIEGALKQGFDPR